jgi:hypothetical protein
MTNADRQQAPLFEHTCFSYLPIRRSMRLSPIRCSRNRIS